MAIIKFEATCQGVSLLTTEILIVCDWPECTEGWWRFFPGESLSDFLEKSAEPVPFRVGDKIVEEGESEPWVGFGPQDEAGVYRYYLCPDCRSRTLEELEQALEEEEPEGLAEKLRFTAENANNCR